ncbi:SET domain-containing protein, partial [Zopfia rhizophila CBS 207.26]
FKNQLTSYVQMYLPDCPFEINTTRQYSVIPEGCVTARRPIDRGVIKYLYGFLVSLKEEEEHDLDVTGRNFTIVTSSRSNCSSLFLGPARFVNHDCEGNAELRPANDGMQIVATRYIRIGEEITVKYGSHYFGEDNCDCLCATCASIGRNG